MRRRDASRSQRGVACLLLAAPALAAARPMDASAQGLPFHTPSALPLPLAESGVRGHYRHVEVGALLRDGEEIANPEGLRVSADGVAVTVPYGLTPRTIIFAGIPYVWRTLEEGGVERSNRGAGDLSVMLKQEILARDFVAGNRRLAVFAAASFPTGATEEGGETLPQPLRLGLGSVNLTGRAVYSYVNDRFGWHGAASYTAATGAVAGVRIGDRFGYDLAVGYRLIPPAYETLRDVTLAVYLELNGTVEQPATEGGDPQVNTGGHTLFLSPGIQLIPLQNWAIEGSFQLPVVRELRGTQLAHDWTLALGARGVFYIFDD